MKNLIVLLTLCLASSVNGQIQFYKQYSNNGYDYGVGVAELEDTSYLVTGSSSSFTDGPSQAFLLKTDSLGNFLWSKHYGGSESEGGRRVLDLGEDGAFIVGYTNSFGFGAYDMYLLKTDFNGNQEWSNTYGTTSWEYVYDAALTADSGVIMVGETRNTPDNRSDIYVVRTDKSGFELWSYQLENLGDDVAKAITQIDDTTFGIAGSIYVSDSSMVKGFVMRIQDNGDILWQDTVGNNGPVELNAIAFEGNKLSLGGRWYISYEDNTFGNYHGITLIDNNFIYELPGLLYPNEECVGLVPFGNDNPFHYLSVSAIENQFSYGGKDIYSYHYDPGLFWLNNMGAVQYVGDEELGQVIRTKDAGAILVGSVEGQVGVGGSNVFLLKLHPDEAIIGSDSDFTTSPLVNLFEENVVVGLIYPNPVVNELTIVGDFVMDLQIVNSLGQQIGVIHHSFNSTFNTNELEPGVYFIRSSDGRFHAEFIKQ